MKVESSISKTVATPNGESKLVRNKDANAPESTKAGNAAEVKLTSSSQLQALAGGTGESQPVDSAKVEAIKQAISEGLFKINPEKIADGLLNSVKDLLANRRA
ncbi:MAG: flagellar biosynthesis anti-sigma factor FlgM [Sulfurimicrobium sp.]|nr:flagellar biosynthesis anti-sigma factor FlgM [Sulfurimicrobium sp.]MDO9190550.1 flagellar biosynthesis anti-sigma factor FlgM [Sulfurimicrobium sp.]MDP1703749.1 flagellar biosynthesis anti-sigma factor FlgM [Sulfurimicrobium sp.]MDP2199154.1 flagellar biosynthesis anti-sigma factor FlgM [Sulfurimicrobium sp.]MDP2962731.1 flagellar biosynthesis anti-sigma factor FlgM [Sulfurimicrobium sp.]